VAGSGAGDASPHLPMEPLEATPISNPGEPIKVALRKGAVLIIALRLDIGRWEPLYAILGRRRVGLPLDFCWTIEAVGVMELAVDGAR
jgi:hypothetical protein